MSSLSVFADPRSVAVVGASADPAKWGYWLARGALAGSHRRAVHLVNAKGAVIEGHPSARSLSELPEAAELVVLSTPAAAVLPVVEEAIAHGTKGFLAITTGLDGVQPGLEKLVSQRITESGARLIGPNCLGIYDSENELELAWGTFTAGNVAVVSQSGQLGLELAGLARHAGMGLSRFVSVGNQSDVTAREVLEDLAAHDATRVVVVYLESFADGRGLVDVLARLHAAGKPVILLTVGGSSAGRAAAKSHTGAMTASIDVVREACRAAGAVLVDTPSQAIDLAHLLLGSPLPAGRRVAVVSDSGGQGAIAADTLARHRLDVPQLTQRTQAQLAAILPAVAAVSNPVDLAGAGEQDLTSYARVVETLLASQEVDSVVLSGYFGCYGDDSPTLAQRELSVVNTLGSAVRQYGAPVVVHSMSHDSAAVREMRARDVPTMHTIDAVARSLDLVADIAAGPDLPGPLVTASDEQVTLGGDVSMNYLDARELLASYGISFPGATLIDEIDSETAGLKAPFVLKAGWIEHKTEVGGVQLGLSDAAAVRAVWTDMHERLGDGEYVVEEMDTRSDTVELIVGGRRDESFGPVVMVGAGGVQAELHRDVALALAPLTVDSAERLIRSLRSVALLDGWRGRPAVDVRSAAAALAAVSELLAQHPEISDAEINPLRVGPDGAVAVDALIHRQEGR